MKKRYCYTGLNRQILILGVPLMFLFWEVIFCVISTFLFGFNVFLMISISIFIHFTVVKEYKKDKNWINHFLFRIRLPERKIYKKDRAYLPESPWGK